MAARGASPERLRRIGVLTPLPVDHPDAKARHAAFLESLRQLGWSEGRNVRIEARGLLATRRLSASTRQNWSLSRLTSSWQLAVRAFQPYSKPPGPCQSCSWSFLIQSAPDLSEAWPNQAAMPLDS